MLLGSGSQSCLVTPASVGHCKALLHAGAFCRYLIAPNLSATRACNNNRNLTARTGHITYSKHFMNSRCYENYCLLVCLVG